MTEDLNTQEPSSGSFRTSEARRPAAGLRRKDRAETEPHDWWDALLVELRSGPWIDLEIVLRELEIQLDLLKSGHSEGDRFMTTCLAKLRMALIEAQVEAAPEAYMTVRPDVALDEAARDTMKYFELFGRPGRLAEDLFHLDYDEYEEITEQLIPVLAVESRSRPVIEVATARLATPPRMINLPQPKHGRGFGSRVLAPVNACAVGGAMPESAMRYIWPVFQYYGHWQVPEDRSAE